MFASRRGRAIAGALAAGAVLALAACSSSGGALSGNSSSASAGSKAIIVGSANFPESEIIAYIYADALTAKGVKASVKPNIGARSVYLAALQDGSINVVPDYSGNLLNYYDKTNTAQSSTDVYAALNDALPKGFEVLNQSAAQDKDSYNVTKAFAAKYNVSSLSDLASVPVPLVIAANPEFNQSPVSETYGPVALKKVYGATEGFEPYSDGGGPATQGALTAGTDGVNLADIYTTTPGIKDFVTLKDPKNMIIAQNVVPVINTKFASATVKSVLDKVSSTLTTEDLIQMNELNGGSQKLEPDVIAKQFVSQHGLN